jgi:hypothetical protein
MRIALSILSSCLMIHVKMRIALMNKQKVERMQLKYPFLAQEQALAD